MLSAFSGNDEHCHRRAAGPLHDCLPIVTRSVSEAAVHDPRSRFGFRPVGKGRFILYRELGAGYVKARGYNYDGAADPTSAEEALRASADLRAMLDQQAGLKPNFRLADDRGRDFDHAMSAVDYVDGQARYVACVPNGVYGRTLKARLTVSAAGHLYECRTGKYLGTTGEVVARPELPAKGVEVNASSQTSDPGLDVELREATGNIFALLPYQVQRLAVAAPARAALGRPIDVKATVVKAPAPSVDGAVRPARNRLSASPP